MSSSYLLNLKINQLQQEIEAIGLYVGYYWNLTASGSMVIVGAQNEYNVTSPTGNNTAYSYSSLTRSGTWEITYSMDEVNTNNMAVGISKNINTVYPGASSQSVQMMEYGMLMDYNAGNRTLLVVVDGVWTSLAGVTLGNNYRISYDGTKLTYYIDDVNVKEYTIADDPVYLVVSSVFGGTVNNISFTGSGGGGGGSTATLKDILQNGNNAGGYTMIGLGGVATTGLSASNIITSPSMYIIEGGNNYPVIDTTVNPPTKYFNGASSGFTPNALTAGVPKSFVKFDMGTDIYSSFSLLLQSLSFTLVPTSGSASAITARIWLSVVQDAAELTNSPLDIGFQINQNLNPVGGDPIYSLPKSVLLSCIANTSTRYLYLTMEINSPDTGRQFSLTNMTVDAAGNGSPSVFTTINPQLL